MDYTQLQSLFASAPPFQPLVPVALLPYIAFTLLFITFTLAFYVSTLPKSTIPVRETVVATVASILGGFGVVALFCTVGVNV